MEKCGGGTMSISKENENNNVPQSVGLDEALAQMKEDNTIPDGFHMMFFSEEFSLTEDCPMNVLLRMVTSRYECSDTLKRQVFQLPKNKKVITYEFAWIGDFSNIKSVLEETDEIINTGIKRMLDENLIQEMPKRRIQFLMEKPNEDEDLF